MKTYLVMFYVVACLLLSPATTLADENTERALAAENKMLRATIDKLRVEIAKLQAEIKQLKEPPKASEPADSNSTSTTDSPNTKPRSLAGNDVLAKALLKYDNADKTTTAKRQEAYKTFCKETSVQVTVDYNVENISTWDDKTAKILITKGTITTQAKTKYPIRFAQTTLSVAMASDIAAKVAKGDKLIITGTTLVQDNFESTIGYKRS